MGLFSRVPTNPVYNTRAVVQRTGVPADTFRAWERRYGVPAPARTAGNQRLYSDRDIATIAWLRDQTRAGLTISQAVLLYHDRERPPSAERMRPTIEMHDAAVPAVVLANAGMARFTSDVVESLVDFDALGAGRAVEEALALLPVEDVCLLVLQPALYEIGRRWDQGEIGVSAEHFASAFVLRKLGTLYNLSQPEYGRGPLVAACLEGELYEVGLLLTALFLSRRGFQILYLGGNVPIDDLVQTVRRLRPPVVILSASTPETASDLATASHELKARSTLPGTPSPYVPTIGFGGLGFADQPALQATVDGVYLGRDAEEAVRGVERVFAGRGSVGE